eukprot:1075284_1
MLQHGNIYLPNAGSADFSQNGIKGLNDLIITAGTNTQDIRINCTNTLAHALGDDCDGMKVYASTAQYLEIAIGFGSEMGGDEKKQIPGEIECPQGSSYAGPEVAACIIDLSGGGL